MTRMSPDQRRETIVDAALAVAVRKGLAGTTVRDVAAEMGSSSGLIHHYFASMDDVLATAFERVAERDLQATAAAMTAAPDPRAAIVAFFRAYAPVEADWAFQLWLDAWSEAARRPAIRATSTRLNLAWQRLLEDTIAAGVAAGTFRCDDPAGAAWRIMSVVDGLALQVVANATTIRRADVGSWSAVVAERELGLTPGALGSRNGRSPRDIRRGEMTTGVG
jgi:AcrR family transcriptional regulator